jgi:hypothetical protein
MKEVVPCFHYRFERIEVGLDIPHTIPIDADDPPEVIGKPQVWFVKLRVDKPPLSNEIPTFFVHLLLLDPDQIIDDLYVDHWGVTLGPAIVRFVWEMKNPKFGIDE